MARRRRLTCRPRRSASPAALVAVVVAAVVGLALLTAPVVHGARITGLPDRTGLFQQLRTIPTYTAGPAGGTTTLTVPITSSDGVQPAQGNVRVKFAADNAYTICTRPAASTTGTVTWTCTGRANVGVGALQLRAMP